jgi:hypothetical protein
MRRQAHTARLAHAAAAAAAAAGLLTVSNGSAAEWAWMRNQDRQAMASDQVSMLKDSACPGQEAAAAAVGAAAAAPIRRQRQWWLWGY